MISSLIVFSHFYRLINFLALHSWPFNREFQIQAFNAGDAAGAAAIYDPDGYFMPNGRNPVKGRAGRLSYILFPTKLKDSGIEAYFREDMADGVQTAQVQGYVIYEIPFNPDGNSYLTQRRSQTDELLSCI